MSYNPYPKWTAVGSYLNSFDDQRIRQERIMKDSIKTVETIQTAERTRLEPFSSFSPEPRLRQPPPVTPLKRYSVSEPPPARRPSLLARLWRLLW